MRTDESGVRVGDFYYISQLPSGSESVLSLHQDSVPFAELNTKDVLLEQRVGKSRMEQSRAVQHKTDLHRAELSGLRRAWPQNCPLALLYHN